MRTIRIILKKEFKQIFRNKVMLPIIFVMPIAQLLILVHAATFEMKNIRLAVVDGDRSSTSRDLIRKFEGSPFYEVKGIVPSVKHGEKMLVDDEAHAILRIPPDFEQLLINEGNAQLQLILNAIDGQAAGLTQAYTQNIILDFNQSVIVDWQKLITKPVQITRIETTYQFWYNPELNYSTFMVPGILVLLVTIIGMFLSGMNLVREKEIGTIEQLNVTPIKKYQFIIGKLVPFWIIALFELAFGLTIGLLLFEIPVLGSVFLLFFAAGIYLLVILGIGLLISTMVDTQQQSMFISWFLAMVFILMSGLFTSIESMPMWAQWLTKINPIAYFIKITRMILLKGSGFTDIQLDLLKLFVFSFLIISLAVFRYKKTA